MFCDLQISQKQPFVLGYKFNEFDLFDLGFARQHIQFSEL